MGCATSTTNQLKEGEVIQEAIVCSPPPQPSEKYNKQEQGEKKHEIYEVPLANDNLSNGWKPGMIITYFNPDLIARSVGMISIVRGDLVYIIDKYTGMTHKFYKTSQALRLDDNSTNIRYVNSEGKIVKSLVFNKRELYLRFSCYGDENKIKKNQNLNDELFSNNPHDLKIIHNEENTIAMEDLHIGLKIRLPVVQIEGDESVMYLELKGYINGIDHDQIYILFIIESNVVSFTIPKNYLPYIQKAILLDLEEEEENPIQLFSNIIYLKYQYAVLDIHKDSSDNQIITIKKSGKLIHLPINEVCQNKYEQDYEMVKPYLMGEKKPSSTCTFKKI